MKYIKLFEEHADYEDFVSGGTMDKPNVSHCIAENDVHYNPIEADNRIVAVFNFPSNGNFALYGRENVGEEDAWYTNEISGASVFDSIEIDGVEYSISEIESQLVVNPTYNSHIEYPMTAGEHTIKYRLKDPTTICDYMFSECLITSIIISDTVTSIGDKAFKFCDNLSGVTLSNSLVTIGDEAFIYNTSLPSINMPDGVTSIGDGAFDSCYSLTSVTLSNSITSIGEAAFTSCTHLTSVNIPNSLVSIGDYAFCGTDLDSSTVALIESINPLGICGDEEEG